MSLEDFVRRNLEGPDGDDDAKDRVSALMRSHLITGMELQSRGLLHEAIKEFAKENDRPLRSDTDKEIAQTSYWHIGEAYMKLGEVQKATIALEKAHELWQAYHVGTAPHTSLAEIYIEAGKFDEAVGLCEELLKDIPDGYAKILLARALELKRHGLE